MSGLPERWQSNGRVRPQPLQPARRVRTEDDPPRSHCALASHAARRWEIRLSINYAVLSIVQICVMLLFVCHLFACVWGLQASFNPLGSWTGQGDRPYCEPYDATFGPCPDGLSCDAEEGWACVGAADMYIYSLYWAIATVTSIGYGDVAATPLQFYEQVICVAMMLSGSLLFAYLVGSFCGLAASLSPDVMAFRQDLTELNRFLAQSAIPSQLRYRLREYMHQTVALRREHTGARLLSELAPQLRNEVALTINRKWLQKIDLLRDEGCEEGVILELAFNLHLRIFPPSESCPIGALYIVSRGAALFAGRAYIARRCWGEADALLTSDRLRFPVPAAAISYLFTYALDGDCVRATMGQAAKYPKAYERMRYHQIRWIIRRGIVRKAEEELGRRMKLLRHSSSGHKRLPAANTTLTRIAAWHGFLRSAAVEAGMSITEGPLAPTLQSHGGGGNGSHRPPFHYSRTNGERDRSTSPSSQRHIRRMQDDVGRLQADVSALTSNFDRRMTEVQSLLISLVAQRHQQPTAKSPGCSATAGAGGALPSAVTLPCQLNELGSPASTQQQAASGESSFLDSFLMRETRDASKGDKVGDSALKKVNLKDAGSKVMELMGVGEEGVKPKSKVVLAAEAFLEAADKAAVRRSNSNRGRRSSEDESQEAEHLSKEARSNSTGRRRPSSSPWSLSASLRVRAPSFRLPRDRQDPELQDSLRA